MMVVITALIAKFMMFAVEIFPKSFVSSASFGYFSYNVTLITLLASLISFGGVNYLLKDLPSARNEFSSFLTTIYISFIIFLILLITPNLSYVVSFSAFGISLIMTTSVYFRFKSKTKSWYLFKDIFKSLFFVLLIIFLGNESISGSELSQLYLYSILISLVLTLFTVMVNYTRQFTLYISLETIKNRAIHSAPIVFTGLTYILVSRVDTFYIKDAFGYESLSDYNFVSRVMYQSLFFMQLFQARKLHKVAALFSKREDELAIKLASEIRRNSTLATIFLASMIALFINTDLVRSYFNISEGFVFEISIVFLLLHVLSSSLGLYGYMLLYIDMQVYSLFNSVVVLILSIVSIPLFISFFGVLGASFGVLLSILSGNFLEKLQFDYFRRNRKYLNYYE